ncbi:Serine/threonine-protein kinase ppk18 [Psilocybe cubensis]|uniref:Serine/threonine-protein kinase ppk18 n=2 Tax=Psilocybe cubensis TaxID=181762 RepID=A0ACB8H468_PSICU|nr:Serine/threonine-protein kinase ppk18 [Psilocybe cubensis]KAH9482800.1 Serine/threonine-protein kinase ppk18 [Psilocybe cubensis]
MSDTGLYQRRQPPSPLVFSPDAILSPVPLQAQQQQSMASVTHGSGSNTVSMPFVRRHVTRRLKAAKTECDKELQRVTNNITAFFEERLREGDHESERDRRDRDQDSQQGDYESLRDAFVYQQPTEFGTATQHSDEYASDGGYDAEPEYSRHSRQRAYPQEPASRPPSLMIHPYSSPGLNPESAQISPASLRRQSTAPWDRPLSSSVSSSALASSPASSTIMLPDVPLTRKSSNHAHAPATPSWGSTSASSRRLSRTIHIPSRPTHSGQSSRSTSRSRSPLPPLSSHASFSEYAVSSGFNRRSSRILVDDPIDPIMSALYEIISVATDVTDTTIAQLTSQPKMMESIVQRVQNIGKTWDDHPDWHGRNWYVQVLLAVASLSRVVEWWEAEKQFWNFDENEDEQDEPLMFVTKPAEDTGPLASSSLQQIESGLEGFRLDDDHNVHIPPTPPTVTRKSRDEQTKDVTHSRLAPPEPIKPRVPVTPSKTPEAAESARVLATERLRLQAETAQNQNIVVELSLDGDHFIWVNHAWRVVVGTDPEGLPGTRISSLLSPSDWGVFKEASQRLQDDDSHTVEVRFKLQIEPNVDHDPSAGSLFQQMEGKGMLMIDREDGQPSHTMWVIKPIAPARFEHDAPTIALAEGDLAPEPASTIRPTFLEPPGLEPVTPFPFSQPICIDPILCRICECKIPQWYFEKHSETCAETHRLEAEIVECNESIAELRNTIRDLCVAVDRPAPTAVPEYRGMQIFTPSTSPIVSSPLQMFRANKMQRIGVKKMQRRFLDQIDDILQVASEIEMPSLKEEEAQEPIERQRLLSPGSERKITQIRQWSKPTTEDAALGQLLQDAERVMRQKIDNVVRMQNTIRYSEKIWHEWQERVETVLATAEESGSESEGTGSNEENEVEGDQEHDVNDTASITSEYGGGSGNGSQRIAEPAPVTSSPPASISPAQPRPASVGTFPVANPPVLHSRQQLHTRSSTPSSVSSPLALAAPIVAPPSPEESMPPMLLDESPRVTGIKSRKSIQNLLEPKFVITPPTSPLVTARDGSSGSLTRESSVKRSHRRHSTANLLTSPPVTGPLSPRQALTQTIARTTPTSIKDFDIIKPISKGAFGSVFLAKKKATGDYYAIKVLKKADMIAKNQITNVKAERMILMKQAESPFVAKLYFTFQSKENLYLVMEYLNGGDCAALIKSLGCLPEEWTKNYIAEVVLGLEYLHQRGVVHRDLKPDNLLIDQHGHLKLTDFGLSRIGLLGRQTREGQAGRPLTRYNSRSRPPSMDSAFLSSPLIFPDPTSGGSYFTQRTNMVPPIGNSPYLPPTDDYGESSGSESVVGLQTRRNTRIADSPLQSFANELTTDLRSHSNSGGGTPPGEQKFVGTPDYLAPETILGLRGDDAAVDWWALGVITYEFLYGIPPFHAETPEKVFENILSGHIEWHEEWIDFSQEARDFMAALMTLDPNERLGSGGAEEVKNHPFFAGIDWEKVTTTEAAFIPQVSDPESTDYFDPRGAIPQLFQDEDQVALQNQTTLDSPTGSSMPPPSVPIPIAGREAPLSGGSDDFGSFSFKNLPVLKQANDDVIRKLKTDQMVPITHTLTEPANFHHQRKRSMSQRMKKPPSVVTNMEPRMPAGPPSPATSTSSIASSPSRTSLPPPTPGSGGHIRKPSEYGAVERFKLNHMEGVDRRNSMPSRLRTASVSSAGDGSGSETWQSTGYGSQHDSNTPPSSVHSIDLRKGPDPSDRIVTCLLAEDNPITAKIIETLLIRLGCRCVVVADGSEAISVAMGDIKFDCILMDLQMPVLDGEGAARYIKSTNGKNTNTPIIAVSAYSGVDPNDTSNIFAASLAKPLQKADLISVMRQLGFKTSTMQGGTAHPKVTASHPIAT